MKLFGKKKSKEEEELEKDEEEKLLPRKKYPKDKDFKDLNPEARRRRKEPVKPWGKGERLLVLITLLLTVGASGFLSLSSRNWKLPGLPRIQKPALPFFEDKRIISGSLKDEQTTSSVQQAFIQKTRNLTGLYGLYMVYLDTGYSFGVYDQEIMQAASLIKLPVMAALFAEAEKGAIDLDSTYVLKNLDKVGGSGSLSTKPAGFEVTYRELLRLMGQQSDNTAFNIARRMLGDEVIEKYINKFGMLNTSVSKNTTTPRDIGMFYQRLWSGNLVSTTARDEMLNYLTDTIYESWLPAGIPEEIRVAHKYGREVHVVNDAGIVYAQRPFVMVILSEGVSVKEADTLIPGVAGIIYSLQEETDN